MAEAGWYVAHTYSGYENKVKANIEKTVANRHLEEEILEVRVPVTETVKIGANGKKKAVTQKLYPGYVLVNMFMNSETWYVVRNTTGVTGFVGPDGKPVPLSDAEVKSLGVKTDTEIEVDFSEGDSVVVVSGVWKDTVGVIKSMNKNHQMVTISVDMFGRETPVTLDFVKVRKV